MTTNYLTINRGQLDAMTGNVLVSTDAGVSTLITDAATADTNSETVQTNLATAIAAFDTAMAAVITAVGTGGTTSLTYTAGSTHQFSGSVSGTAPTPTVGQINAIATAANTALTALLTAITAATTAEAAVDTVVTDVAALTLSPTADFTLATLTTHSPTRKDTLLALESFKNYILSDGVAGGRRGTDLPNT